MNTKLKYFVKYSTPEGEGMDFYDTEAEALKAYTELFEEAQDRLPGGYDEEPEIIYGQVFAELKIVKGPAQEDSEFDEQWTFEDESHLPEVSNAEHRAALQQYTFAYANTARWVMEQPMGRIPSQEDIIEHFKDAVFASSFVQDAIESEVKREGLDPKLNPQL